MKILVAVKRVIDFAVKIRVKADHSGVETDNVKMSMNPFDEIAMEEAIRLKEAGIASEIVVISIGPEPTQDTLRHALALGADRGIHVLTETAPESLTVAKTLKELVARENPQLLMLGKQAIDDDCNQVAQMIAGLLNWPQATFTSNLTIENNTCQAVREVDGGLETLTFPLPAVISTDLRLNTPRYPTLPNIMKSKQKPLQQLSLSDLGIEDIRHTKILQVIEPTPRQAGIKVTSVEELITQIRKVIS